MKFVALVAAVTLVASPLTAQCTPANSLSTTLAPNNGQSGYMFDLEPTGGSPLIIQSFDVITTVGVAAATYQVWVRPPLQSWVGFNTSNVGWTLLGTSAPVVSTGATTPVPLNLCMGYTLLTGGRTGFYVTATTGTSTRYTNGTTVGTVWASNTNLTVYQGNGGGLWAVTFTPRNFTGIVRYDPAQNILAMSQTGPGVGNLTVSLTNPSPTAIEGWTLISGVVTSPAGSGPLLGIFPDSNTIFVIGLPLADGNPFHFPNPSSFGLFPNTPFVVGPGSVTGLTGLTLDFVCYLVGPAFAYVGRSNVVRFTFQ